MLSTAHVYSGPQCSLRQIFGIYLVIDLLSLHLIASFHVQISCTESIQDDRHSRGGSSRPFLFSQKVRHVQFPIA